MQYAITNSSQNKSVCKFVSLKIDGWMKYIWIEIKFFHTKGIMNKVMFQYILQYAYMNIIYKS